MNKTIKAAIAVLLGLLYSINHVQAIELVGEDPAGFAHARAQQVLIASVELLLVDNNELKVIPPTHELKSGDRFRLRLRTSIDSDYRLFVLDRQGKTTDIPPIEGRANAGEASLVPSPQLGILALDDKPGTEWLQLVVMTKKPKTKMSVDKHPHGKIEQIILRNVELLAPVGQKVHYDPLSQAIYLSPIKWKQDADELRLKLGLHHTSADDKSHSSNK